MSTKDDDRLDEQDLEETYALLDAGRVDEARARVAAWLKARPGDPDARLVEAACLRAAGDDAQAEAVLRALCEDEPDWVPALLALADVLRSPSQAEAARLKEALGLATRALDAASAAEDDEGDEGDDVEHADVIEALLCKAALELELERPMAARATLDELPPPQLLAEQPALGLEAADLHLRLEDGESARALAEAVLDRLEEEGATDGSLVADAWYLAGCAAELTGDEEAMVAAWVRVRALDAEEDDAEAPWLSEDEVVAVAEAALGELPEAARALLANVPILVADLPPESEVEAGLDPRVLGMFAGTPHGQESVLEGAAGAGLRQIYLFRRNLDRHARDADELRDEIRTTLLHETGHFFGLDEADLARLGLD